MELWESDSLYTPTHTAHTLHMYTARIHVYHKHIYHTYTVIQELHIYLLNTHTTSPPPHIYIGGRNKNRKQMEHIEKKHQRMKVNSTTLIITLNINRLKNLKMLKLSEWI